MKRTVIVFLILAGLSGCSQYSCPTYDGYGGKSYAAASTKKSKTPKAKQPYYKSMKRAEQ